MNESPDERLGLPSASNWRRYELCAGSWALEGEARRLGQLAYKRSPEADRGDRIHARLAGAKVELDEAEETTAAFLRERALEQVNRIFGSTDIPSITERRLWLDYDGKKALSGRFDVCYFTEKLALVIDYKTGWREPDAAEQNAQLKVLAVLVGIALPSVEEIVVLQVSGPYGVTEARYNLEALSQAYREIIATLRAINAEYAGFAPSPEACRYCPAINICEAVNKIAATQYTMLPDGEQAAAILDQCEVLERRIETVREHYAERMTNDPNYQIPGFAMVPGSIRREVTDWEVARQRLGEWLDLSEIEAASNYRLGDLERALGKKLSLKGKPLKERMNTILQGLVEERQNGASLKRVKGKALVSLELP